MRLLIAIAFALGASARRASSQRHRALSDASLRDDSLCPEGEKPSPKAKVRWLRETSDNANQSYNIGIPKRATDLDCYTATKWREEHAAESADAGDGAGESDGAGAGEAAASAGAAPDAGESAAAAPGGGESDADAAAPQIDLARRPRALAARAPPERPGPVAIAIMGELQRVDPNTTIADRAVAPLARAGHAVHVFLTLQAVRPKVGGEWHGTRFEKLPVFDTRAAQQAAVDGLVARFARAGAAAVHVHIYDFVRLPPLMPSRKTGGPGHGHELRFELAWTSYALHCMVHSLVWRDVERYEARRAAKGAFAFQYVVQMRNDAYWFASMPVPAKLRAGGLAPGTVAIKKCLNWNGVNDKFAFIPRQHAKQWMQLLEAYYDPSFVEYKNSEVLQLRIAERYNIPFHQFAHEFLTTDFYYWETDESGGVGCFPHNYAGLPAPGQTKINPQHGSCKCFTPEICRNAQLRICRKLYRRRRRRLWSSLAESLRLG